MKTIYHLRKSCDDVRWILSVRRNVVPSQVKQGAGWQLSDEFHNSLDFANLASSDVFENVCAMLYLPVAVDKQHPALYAAGVFIILAPLYYISWQYNAAHAPLSRTVRPPSNDFVTDWLDVHLLEPFNPSAVGVYCNTTTWRPNLVFNLANANGGIGNVRGNILDFLFVAIEAGASIMLPGMASRSETDISNVWASRAPFDLFFDEDWFLDAMSEACPQMTIYKSNDGQQLSEALPGNYLPQSRRMDASTENTRQAYLTHLDAWLSTQPAYSPDNITLVNLERTLWDIDTRSLPASFRRNFPQVLRTNPSVRHLAALTAQSLALQNPLILLDPRDAIPKASFYGAHLRTEADAQSAGWNSAPNTNFTAQTDAYIAHALAHKLSLLYVASGNASELARFREKVAAHTPPLSVTSKLDLLPPSARQELDALTWDQQALVDYEVLRRCSVFGGFVKSSFSFKVAMSRAQRGEDEAKIVEPFRVKHEDDEVCFDDGVSRIVGRDGWHEQRIPRGMWP
jgi:hypothetical protein